MGEKKGVGEKRVGEKEGITSEGERSIWTENTYPTRYDNPTRVKRGDLFI